MYDLGMFGCETIWGCEIPYITRMINGEHVRFVSVRMAERQLLRFHLMYTNPEIYKCISVKSYLILECEALVLNQLNIHIFNNLYGRSLFQAGRDYIVRLEDVQELCEFFEFCSKKIQCRVRNERCGFIKINKVSIVPYCRVNGKKKYIPLFFLEGPIFQLKHRSIKLDNWDLAYLKFACIAMGVDMNLYTEGYSCDVINFRYIKQQFPRWSRFIDYWPLTVTGLQPLKTLQGKLIPLKHESCVWIMPPITTSEE